MVEFGITAHDHLRDEILANGNYDFMSMADIQAIISEDGLADSELAGQKLVVDTVRSLLADGLVDVGAISGRNDSGFTTWPGTVDDVMTQFTDRFVTHHDDEHGWLYTIWLNLTAEGKRAAADIIRRRSDS